MTRRKGKEPQTIHSTDPREIRARLVHSVLECAEADVAGFYSAGLVEGRVSIAHWVTAGGKAVESAYRDVAADPRFFPALTATMIRAPTPMQTRSFVELDVLDRDRLRERTEYWRRIALKYDLTDQIRLLVYQGDRFLGWVGAYRHRGGPRFARRDRRRLAPLVAFAAASIIAADTLARKDMPENAFVVVRPDGTVESATPAGCRWLDRPGFMEAVAAAVRCVDSASGLDVSTALREADARIVRLDAKNPVRYLVRFRELAPIRRDPVLTLTAKQRTIAEAAAAGATVPEIAQSVGRDVETVRSHLRKIYAALGVSSRVELGRILRGDG